MGKNFNLRTDENGEAEVRGTQKRKAKEGEKTKRMQIGSGQ